MFSHELTRSAFIATLGVTDGVGASAPGEITVAGRNNLPSGIFALTRNSAGVLADRGFHIVVHS